MGSLMPSRRLYKSAHAIVVTESFSLANRSASPMGINPGALLIGVFFNRIGFEPWRFNLVVFWAISSTHAWALLLSLLPTKPILDFLCTVLSLALTCYFYFGSYTTFQGHELSSV